MKIYTTEELQQYVVDHLKSGKGVVCCRSRRTPGKESHKFICLQENISYQLYWRGGIQSLNAGDFLHANPLDLYGISAEKFTNCYAITSR